MSVLKLFIAVFLSLISTISAADWQGYGNVSTSNLTEIWAFINSNIKNAVISSSYTEFSTALSNHLNSLWDPAWNVFTVKTIAQKDAIFYGYAFRDHWMWYNGYEVNGVVLSFVLWKDYNCYNWTNINGGLSSNFTDGQQIIIYNLADSSMFPNNVWMVAKKIMNKLTQTDGFNGNSGYSLVLSEDGSMYGRVCALNNKQFYFDINAWQSNYKAAIFQTRQ